MGMATNILIVLFAVSAVSWIYGVAVTNQWMPCPSNYTVVYPATCNHYAPLIFQFINPSTYGSDTHVYNASLTDLSFTDQAFSFISDYFLLILLMGVGITGIVTALGFPNPYIIFAPAAVIFFNLAVIPNAIISNLIFYEPLRVVIVAVLNILFVIAVLSWWKQGDTP